MKAEGSGERGEKKDIRRWMKGKESGRENTGKRWLGDTRKWKKVKCGR